MPIYDITLTIDESLPVWPGDPPVALPKVAHLERGDVFTLTRLDISAHTGTHLDAPAHFLAGGAGVETLDLEVLVGPALVVEALDAGLLTAAVLSDLAIPAGTRRVLFHTRDSERWARGDTQFTEDFVAISADGARWLVDRGVWLVGVDYLSVGPFANPAPTHQVLLAAGVVPVEGLNLHGVEPGEYTLVCLPMKIAGGDGAPCRAILIRE